MGAKAGRKTKGHVSVPYSWQGLGGHMDYRNSEMKLDQLIGYFNDGKINLIPPFQRGHVWKLPQRKGLIRNIVSGRPIPAIFLYKEPIGSKYSYNILDGKQRLESLLLFVGSKREDVNIQGLNRYFYERPLRAQANFSIEIEPKTFVTFADLDDDAVRDFREYAIPTIEINLEDSDLDEIISLFVDINQQGAKVTRFDIVKAMRENPLLDDSFKLIAQQQKRGMDIRYKVKNTDFSRVLSRLQVVQGATGPNAKVDRMWERLLEIALFCRTRKHRAPAAILKSFIKGSSDIERAKITVAEKNLLETVFKFLAKTYVAGLSNSKFATDQTHFYTMATSLVAGDLLMPVDQGPPDFASLKRKLLVFGKIIDGKEKAHTRLAKLVRDYQARSVKQTTHIGQREARQTLFLRIIEELS